MGRGPVAVTAAPAGRHQQEHARHGFWTTYVFSTDHKMIGRQYLMLGVLWAVVGGLLAGAMRWQLAWPDTAIPLIGEIGPETFNMFVTMHGTIMVFFVAMPILLGAFGNFLIPLMIGARDMVFPRLNAMSVWTFALASVVMLASFFVEGGAAAAGWTAYPPLSARADYTGVEWGMNLWILALALEFASFLMGGVNYLTTVLALRAPGMSLMRMPLVVWQQLAAATLFLLSVGPLIAGAIMLLLDRTLGTAFYAPDMGGDPLLWQHLFWFFGHPEVYILVLPSFGIVSEVIPVFSRRPIFGYWAMAGAMAAIGFISYIVWVHHMFTTSVPQSLRTIMMLTTYLVGVPTGIKIFNWLATLWGGKLHFKTPMLFALGLVAMFTIGGITGIFLASIPLDIPLQDTYFVVAHFHYVLFGGSVFGFFAGLYYWFPKMTGRMYHEGLGKLHFVLTFIGLNLTFWPQHELGMMGMPRRIATYSADTGWGPLNMASTVGAFILGLSQAIMVANILWSRKRGPKAGPNPWGGSGLEWTISSPPPAHNFDGVPVLTAAPEDHGHGGGGLLKRLLK